MDFSCDYTIDIIKNNIKNFARIKAKGNGPNYKIIIIEDADTMSASTQLSLFRIIENYSHITRFCLICNSINKLSDSLRSRCFSFYFSPISDKGIAKKLNYIINQEKLEDINLKRIIKISNGDIRKAINNLHINDLNKDISMNRLFETLNNKNFNDIQEEIYKLFQQNYYKKEILNNIFMMALENNMSDIVKICATINGKCNEKIQLMEICSHFT
jgi:DNA polymerase III delta prime subunit